MNKPEQKEEIKLDEVGTKTLLALLSTRTRTEAADVLGIGRTTLYNRIEQYQLEKYMALVPQQALSVLQQSSVDAAENFVNKLKSRNETVSMEASKEILDRVGIKAQQNPVGPNIQVNIHNAVRDDVEEFTI